MVKKLGFAKKMLGWDFSKGLVIGMNGEKIKKLSKS
jgi:hypothetical protein